MLKYICSYCQTEYTPKCKKPKGKIQYCSISCVNKAQPRKKRTQKCKYCLELMPKGKVYCSTRCKEEAFKIRKLDRINQPKVLNKIEIKKHREREVRRAQNLKLKAVQYKGGACICCGYQKCISALEFHHLDPHIKEMGIAQMRRTWEKLKVELDKCVLVCSNCHREIHKGVTHLPK